MVPSCKNFRSKSMLTGKLSETNELIQSSNMPSLEIHFSIRRCGTKIQIWS